MKNNTPLIIPLSFKNTQEDIELYNWISKHSNKSGFIKDILKQNMKAELTKNN
jgi:nitroimidazol reductase NimA-like FMN-containing flavoprotein (pyridoxamine 5'-phosphate oxidase superfamily)